MWPFNRKDRKKAQQMMDRLERQEPEVKELVRELKRRRQSNKFREDFAKTLRGETT